MILLDTDDPIDVQRAHAAALAWFASLADDGRLPAGPGRHMHVQRQALSDGARTGDGPSLYPVA